MGNPFNVLKQGNPLRGYDFGRLRTIYKGMKGRNPMEMLGQMSLQNPRLQPVVQAINGGANPQQLFKSLCQQRGINPDEFINNIIGNNGR